MARQASTNARRRAEDAGDEKDRCTQQRLRTQKGPVLVLSRSTQYTGLLISGKELRSPRFEDPERVDPWCAGSREVLCGRIWPTPREATCMTSNSSVPRLPAKRETGMEIPRRSKPAGSWVKLDLLVCTCAHLQLACPRLEGTGMAKLAPNPSTNSICKAALLHSTDRTLTTSSAT